MPKTTPLGTVPRSVRVRWRRLPRDADAAPELELAPAESHYVDASAIPGDDRVRVLLGTFGEMQSVIPYPSPVTYLHVTLRDGEAWSYPPAAGHEVAWLAVSAGAAQVDGTLIEEEVAVFEEGDGRIDLVAVGDTELVIASAVKHPHALVTGIYSVHTSADALRRGEAGYRRIALERKAALRR